MPDLGARRRTLRTVIVILAVLDLAAIVYLLSPLSQSRAQRQAPGAVKLRYIFVGAGCEIDGDAHISPARLLRLRPATTPGRRRAARR